jgi:hypothetical protein
MVMEVLKDTCSLVKSLSGPSMIKLFKQIKMKMSDCIQSRVVFRFIMVSVTMFYPAWY